LPAIAAGRDPDRDQAAAAAILTRPRPPPKSAAETSPAEPPKSAAAADLVAFHLAIAAAPDLVAFHLAIAAAPDLVDLVAAILTRPRPPPKSAAADPDRDQAAAADLVDLVAAILTRPRLRTWSPSIWRSIAAEIRGRGLDLVAFHLAIAADLVDLVAFHRRLEPPPRTCRLPSGDRRGTGRPGRRDPDQAAAAAEIRGRPWTWSPRS